MPARDVVETQLFSYLQDGVEMGRHNRLVRHVMALFPVVVEFLKLLSEILICAQINPGCISLLFVILWFLVFISFARVKRAVIVLVACFKHWNVI